MKKIKDYVKNYLKEVNDNGFSLLELVVAVGVLLVLTVGGLLAYNGITQNARVAAVQSAADEVYTGAVAYDSNGEVYTQAATEWMETRNGDTITVSAWKSTTGAICAVAEMESHDITVNRGAGCDGVPAGGSGDENGPDLPIVGSIENCEVVDGTVVINSENIQELASTIETEFITAGALFDENIGAYGSLGQVVELFELDTNVGPMVEIQASGGVAAIYGVDVALEDAINSILASPLVDSNGLVSIDLITGVITINGSDACSEVNKSDIDAAIAEALGTLSTRANDVFVSDVLNNVGLVIETPADVSRMPMFGTSANVDIVVETTFGQLYRTAEGEHTIRIDGDLNGIISDEDLLSALETPVNTFLISPLHHLVPDFVDTLSDNMEQGIDGHVQEIIEGDKW